MINCRTCCTFITKSHRINNRILHFIIPYNAQGGGGQTAKTKVIRRRDTVVNVISNQNIWTEIYLTAENLKTNSCKELIGEHTAFTRLKNRWLPTKLLPMQLVASIWLSKYRQYRWGNLLVKH